MTDTGTVDHRLLAVLAVALTGACGAEATSFRPIDRADPRHIGPLSAVYDAAIAGQVVAKVHVWSSGGYVTSDDEPMTHLGFEINSAVMQPLTLDVDALELAVFDVAGNKLPAPQLASTMPLGASLVTVRPGGTALFGAYYALPVAPRDVERMQAHWILRRGTDEFQQVTGFVRDDDAQLIEYPSRDRQIPQS